ncbi:MAG: L,D-transpeptidase family protein [Planctomycetota bacterium]
MGKTIVWLVAGVGLGIGVMSIIQRGGDGDTSGAGGDVQQPQQPAPNLVGHAVASKPGGASPATPGGAGTAPAVQPGTPGAGGTIPGAGVKNASFKTNSGLPEPRVAYSGGPNTATPAPANSGLEIVAQRINAALRQGQESQAASMIRGLIQQARHYPNSNFAREALTLLRLESDVRFRREALLYLRDRPEGPAAFSAQLERANTLSMSTKRDELIAAWPELSLAYDIAASAEERRGAVEALRSYTDRMVFQRRFTPILKSHAVVTGDTLLKIAIKHGTTVDAIRRINGLSSDTIQPRTRLLILAGQVKIFVKKSEFRLWLAVDDKVFLHFPVGLGRDNRTPASTFAVKVKQKDPTWYPGAGKPPIPAGDPRNVLGSRWLGFADTEEFYGFGIHATSSLSDLNTESSAGCVRLLTDDMELLYDFVPRGTVVTILD